MPCRQSEHKGDIKMGTCQQRIRWKTWLRITWDFMSGKKKLNSVFGQPLVLYKITNRLFYKVILILLLILHI